MPTPALRVYVAFNNNPLDASPTFVDVSTRAIEAAVFVGRHRELDLIEPGTATVVFNNARGEFDPTNPSSPYYPNVLPMKRIRIELQLGVATYPLFDGYVERWIIDYNVGGYRAVARCVDALKLLALYELNGTFPQQTSGARITAVLDAVGWPSARRDITPGISQVLPASLSSVPALQHIRDVVFAEQGYLWVNGAGTVVFRDRHTAIKVSADTASVEFAADEITDAELVYADDPLFTEVVLSRTSGPVFTGSDAAAIARFGRRVYKNTDLQLASDVEIQSKVDWLLGKYKDPMLRVNRFSIEWAGNASTWEKFLPRTITDRAAVNILLGNRTIRYLGVVEGIEYRIGRGKIIGSMWLSPAERINFLVLDDNTLGRLDVNMLAF